MAEHTLVIQPGDLKLTVPTGTLVSEAIQRAGLDLAQPCGGQGRCGRCAVVIEGDGARRRSTIRLSEADLEAGRALACQTVIEGELTITIPPQEQVQRRLVTDKAAAALSLPFTYDPSQMQSLRLMQLNLAPPTLQEALDDEARLRGALAQAGFPQVELPLAVLRKLPAALRESEWSPWALVARPLADGGSAHLIDLTPQPIRPLGLALDIGTTTVTVYLIDLENGKLLGSAAEYNGQIARGEDVISRIIYASKGEGLKELGDLLRQTLSALLERLRLRTGVEPGSIHKMTVAGNTTMIHLFLGLPPAGIRLTPYVPVSNRPPDYSAAELDLPLHPQARIDVLPGVASYVGADITAGVLACGLSEAEALTLFIDVGTNGEIVLGTRDWMVTCACSAGPAFEGAGVVDGMRATEGAIEEVWVHSETLEPTYRVIGNQAPRGLCGSGLISLLAELFVTGVIDRGGNIKLDLDCRRVRQGAHGPEYVIAWGSESEHGNDIVLTKVDVDNLMRAKAAIYAGFTVLASSVGLTLQEVQQVLVGGSFGQYINVEKAIQIGLLPDLPWGCFHFLGNTSVQGTAQALLSSEARKRVAEIASHMTYLELSADNSFYDNFTAALFLPHTEIGRFPSVAEVWENQNGNGSQPPGAGVSEVAGNAGAR
jgi:uncharacterized 2Fe-2S/4Fe-4S cluster protein (DUF4445 family)